MQKIILFALTLILCPFFLKGQYFLYNPAETQKLEIKFVKHSIEVKSGKTIFNVVKITNRSSQQQSFNLNLTVPSGWQVIGTETQEIILNPIDSIMIPVRVAIGEKVRGDIGYSIIAALTDNRGNTIKNEYCFIKIPRETDVSVKVISRFDYFEQQTGLVPIKIKIANKGNREEMVNILLDADELVGITSAKLKYYTVDINVPPYSDTTVTVDAYLNKDVESSKEMYKVNVNAKTFSGSYKTTVWLRNLSNEYENLIPSSRKALIAELYGRGLFSSYSKPSYGLMLQGDILLKKNRELYFFYNMDNPTPYENLYKNNRMWMGYKTNKLNLQIGDISKSIVSSLFGRGITGEYKFKKIKFEAIATKNILNPQYNYGFSTTISPIREFNFTLAGAINNKTDKSFNSKLALFGTNFTLFKLYRFGLEAVYNKIEFNNNQDHKNAVGLTGTLNYSKNQLTISIKYKSGQKYLYSSYNGRSELIAQSHYQFKSNSTIQYYILDNRISPENYSTNQTIAPFTNSHKQDITYDHFVNSALRVYTGTGFEYNSTDNFPSLEKGRDFFSTLTYNGKLGIRIKGQKPGSSLTSQIYTGFVNVKNRPIFYYNPNTIVSESKNKFNYQYYTINLRQPRWGFQFSYTNGPKSIYEQFAWYLNSKQTKLLRIMPYFDSFIYKEQIKLTMNLSYSNDLVKKSSYTNITTQINWYLPKDWQFRFLNVYTVQSRITATEAVERFSTIYFEAAIRKEFGIQQPALKFYNLKFTFFKDYNGNRVMNDNEPGLKNVLVNLQRIDEGANEFSDFTSGELLSNQFGEVVFDKIPAGVYRLSYNPLGNEAGNFSKSETDLTIKLDKNSNFYIPFVEKNKVFGKIVLNRSRLSGLGKVDVSNIRITATDSRGNIFSTLTNKEGEFTIYAPVTDEYIVNINNIFYEDFDLRQNNFRVQFNGYKQFEVNFVFDEKVRRINFSPSTQDNLAEGVLQIRRTNLRGTVKDATSLKPLRARINLVNTKNNSVVTSIYSNPQTGDYALSFLAEDIYLLEILADDYWYYSENLNLNQVTTFMNVTKDILLKQISIGSKIELNIRFEINKSALGPETVAELNRLLRILKDNSNIKIEIQGHCDDLEAVNNPQIGEERAKAVAKYLIENGFSNIQVRGFGNTAPIAPSDTEENRSLNRRVEVEVISK